MNQQAIQISEHVWWVGAIDAPLREFHGYTLDHGTTYNAFLILGGESPVLIDAVKAPFYPELRARVESVLGDFRKIRILVSNHAEGDHSGAIPAILADVPGIQTYASPMGCRILDAQYGIGAALTPLKTGEELPLGNGLSLRALETRMIHWPDSMFTYLPADRLLFSQDGFGMHLAVTPDRLWVSRQDPALVEAEMRSYFANILLPYTSLIQNLLKTVASLHWPIDLIAPDHGPLWRGPDEIAIPLSRYATWAAQQPARRAVIAYDTMWGATGQMAHAIADALRAENVPTDLFNLHHHSRSDVATAVLCAGALLIGTPTLNNTLFPSLADTLCYLRGLRPKNLKTAVFGSYGWGGEGTAHAAALLEDMKLPPFAPPLKLPFASTPAHFEACRAFARQLAAELPDAPPAPPA